jgi:hypothetical protein
MAKKGKSAPAKVGAPEAKGNGQKSCTVEGCKRGYRAKGYCFFHYKKWRAGELGHARYKTCSNADCLKKATQHGMCDEHHAAWRSARKGAAAPSAAPPPPSAPPPPAAA